MLHHHSDIKDIEYIECLRSFIPLIITSTALNILKNLSLKCKTKDLRKLIFPAIIAFFVPPLVANLVYKQFIVTNTVLISFFSAVLLFPILIRVPFVIFWMSKFCKFGRFLFLRSLRDNKQPISHVTLWPILSDFVGIFLFKILSGDSNFEISQKTFLNTMLSGFIVFIARQLHLNDSFLFFIILMIEIGMFTYEKLYEMDEKVARGSVHSLLHLFDTHKKKKEKSAGMDAKTYVENISQTETQKMENTKQVSNKIVEPRIDDPFESDIIQIEESENESDGKRTTTKRRGRPKKHSKIVYKKNGGKKKSQK